MKYDARKMQALDLFRALGWLRPGEVADRLALSSALSATTNCICVWRFGLLERRFSGKAAVI